ncbi:MAG: hypothetical protein ACOCQG_01840 [Candidatus Nanoarchaeia archaeon]
MKKMKLYLILIFSLVFILISCSAEDNNIENNKDNLTKETEEAEIITIEEETPNEEDTETIEDFEEILHNNNTDIDELI